MAADSSVRNGTADVVVVGAGPGGSAAAHWLARAGADVVLLERARFPRDKSCGDGITAHSVAILHDMGVRFEDFDGKGARTWGGIIGAPSGGKFQADPPPHSDGARVECWVVPRMSFDERLARAAVSAGAKLREESAFTGMARSNGGWRVGYADGSGARAIDCKLVIGADGAHSGVAKSLGVRESAAGHLGFALRGYYDGVQGLTDNLEIWYYDRATLPGYGWIFPTGGGMANIGIGIYTGELRRSKKKMRELLDEFIEQTPAIAQRCRDARAVGRATGWPLPVSSAQRQTVFDGALLVGDAASLVDPLSGEGIWTALVSGRSAARAAMRALASGDGSRAVLRSHEREWRAEAGGYLSSGRLLKNLAKSARLLDLIVHRAAQNPYYASRAIGYGLGTIDRRRALRSIVLKAIFQPSFFSVRRRDAAQLAAGR
ncbi:MAG: geranylgeranyl reductase family protein [Candidatus Eremiobacteraeota bacterium]|nr:geranylgeranyl reductase family protein [Candidatus Eremiobacteraeota bacterium]